MCTVADFTGVSHLCLVGFWELYIIALYILSGASCVGFQNLMYVAVERWFDISIITLYF